MATQDTATPDSTRRFWRGLRFKVALQMLLAALLPVVVLTSISHITFNNTLSQINDQLEITRQTTEANVQEDMRRRAKRIVSQVDDFMLDHIQDVIDWTRVPYIVEAVRRTPEEVEEQELPSLTVDTLSRYDIDDIDSRLTGTQLLEDQQITGYLDNLTGEDRAFAELFFTDANGYIAAMSNPTSDFVQIDEEWWQIAWTEGIHVDEPEFDASANSLVVAISVRIDDQETGAPLGVLKAALKIDVIKSLADQSTTVLQKSEVSIYELNQGYRLADTSSNHSAALILQEKGNLSAEKLEELRQITPGSAVYQTDEERVYGYARTDDSAVYEALNGFTGFNWIVEFNQPKTLVFETVNDLTSMGEEIRQQERSVVGLFAIVALGTVAVSLGLATWQTSLITHPITRLQQTAQRLSAGDMEARAQITSKDELGALAATFNQMAADLQDMVEAERQSRAYLERTVTTYVEFVTKVAGGNLKDRLALDSDQYHQGELYQLGANLNIMVDSLREMASEIRETASGISSNATEIQAATNQQMASASEQEAAVTQTATTMEEVRTTVAQTSARAQSVAEASEESITVARNGEKAVADSVEGMEIIRERVESIAENILMLSGHTQQIGEIIQTVNEIAEQSKLLALNASIEAARAGEEGKGFAVVAMEVRQLAEQSREATARVRDLLSEIQQATNTAVMVTEEGSKGAESGMILVERAGEAIQQLAGTLDESIAAVSQIAASAQQQTNGVDQLATAMSSIKQASSQAAASTRQTERSAQALLQMAQQMEEVAERYQL